MDSSGLTFSPSICQTDPKLVEEEIGQCLKKLMNIWLLTIQYTESVSKEKLKTLNDAILQRKFEVVLVTISTGLKDKTDNFRKHYKVLNRVFSIMEHSKEELRNLAFVIYQIAVNFIQNPSNFLDGNFELMRFATGHQEEIIIIMGIAEKSIDLIVAQNVQVGAKFFKGKYFSSDPRHYLELLVACKPLSKNSEGDFLDLIHRQANITDLMVNWLFRIHKHSLLIMDLEGSDLHEIFKRFQLSFRERCLYMQAVVRLSSRLRQLKFFHGDFTFKNIVLGNETTLVHNERVKNLVLYKSLSNAGSPPILLKNEGLNLMVIDAETMIWLDESQKNFLFNTYEPRTTSVVRAYEYDREFIEAQQKNNFEKLAHSAAKRESFALGVLCYKILLGFDPFTLYEYQDGKPKKVFEEGDTRHEYCKLDTYRRTSLEKRCTPLICELIHNLLFKSDAFEETTKQLLSLTPDQIYLPAVFDYDVLLDSIEKGGIQEQRRHDLLLRLV